MEAVLDEKTLRKARLIGALGSRLLHSLGATWRVRILGLENETACLEAGRGFIYAFWHGRLLPLTHLRSRRGIVVLVSLNRDGEFITQTIHRMGFRTVRGSSSRGGLRALLEMARCGKRGDAVAFTPDGPRGPRAKLQPGVLVVAQRAGVPIVPLAVSAWPRKVLSSWDRMMIPAPFARVVMAFGTPIHLRDAASPEEAVDRYRAPVEQALAEVTALSDREVLRWAGKEPGDVA